MRSEESKNRCTSDVAGSCLQGSQGSVRPGCVDRFRSGIPNYQYGTRCPALAHQHHHTSSVLGCHWVHAGSTF